MDIGIITGGKVISAHHDKHGDVSIMVRTVEGAYVTVDISAEIHEERNIDRRYSNPVPTVNVY